MSIIVCVVVALLAFAAGCMVGMFFQPSASPTTEKAEHPPRPEYWLPSAHRIDVIAKLIAELPTFVDGVCWWEVMVEPRPGHRDGVLTLSLVDARLNTTRMIGHRNISPMGRSSWSALDDCGRSYVVERLHGDVLLPLIKAAARAVRDIPGVERPDPIIRITNKGEGN